MANSRRKLALSRPGGTTLTQEGAFNSVERGFFFRCLLRPTLATTQARLADDPPPVASAQL